MKKVDVSSMSDDQLQELCRAVEEELQRRWFKLHADEIENEWQFLKRLDDTSSHEFWIGRHKKNEESFIELPF